MAAHGVVLFATGVTATAFVLDTGASRTYICRALLDRIVAEAADVEVEVLAAADRFEVAVAAGPARQVDFAISCPIQLQYPNGVQETVASARVFVLEGMPSDVPVLVGMDLLPQLPEGMKWLSAHVAGAAAPGTPAPTALATLHVVRRVGGATVSVAAAEDLEY